MRWPTTDAQDRAMMERCIALSRKSGQAGEYPYGAVITRGDEVVAESINRVQRDGDVTRHAEVATISEAQKVLRTVSLDDCTIYVNAEPCAFCSYAIRETRIRRVVYALDSPHMGGVLKWGVLTDEDICHAIPEVFAPPPEIVSGFMAEEAEAAMREWSPLVARILTRRRLFETSEQANMRKRPESWRSTRAMALVRRSLFDWFGRR